MQPITSQHLAPSLEEIEAAAKALAGRIVATPVAALAADRTRAHLPPDSQVAIKLELFQHAGSFKARAALLHVDRLDAKARQRGVTAVSAHALKTLNVSTIRGRDFTDAEGQARQPVAIINETFAERFWPNEDAIGRQFRVNNPEIPDSFTIIGIVRDVQHFETAPRDEKPAHAYVPFPYGATPNVGITIRVAGGDPAAITGPVREEIRRLDSGIPLFNVRSMIEVKRLGSWQYGMFGWLFSTFGAVALLLAATGVYGLLAYAVSQRTQEIGVRVALGAARRDVVRLIVGQGLRLTMVGIVIGLLASFAVTGVVASILYNVTPTDPATSVGASLFLLAIASLASYVPTRRATAVDPLIALRSE